MMPKALGTVSSGTRRITVAVASDQNPPTTTPRRAPAETDIRNEFVYAATNGESESLPLKLALRSEPILIGIRYLNIGRIGVPTWPVFRIYQIRPNYFGWSIYEYLVVNKSIGLFR